MPTCDDGKLTTEQFISAAAQNDVDALERYIAQGGNIDAKIGNGPSALITAIESRSVEFVIELIMRSPDLGPQWMDSAMRAAVECGMPRMIDAVYFETVQQTRVSSLSEIAAAIDSGRDGEIRRYVRQGQRVDELIGAHTLLSYAALKKQYAIMRLLLAAGANPNPPNIEKKLMCTVAHFGDVEVAKILIEFAGAEELLASSASKTNGHRAAESTPLSEAAGAHRPEMLAFLIDNGADVTAVDRNGIHPAICVLNRFIGGQGEPKGLTTLRTLLDRLPKPMVTANFSNGIYPASLLHRAASEDLPWAVDEMIARGVPVDQLGRTEQGKLPPLHVAAFHGSLEAIRALIRNGADVMVRSDDGRTALHCVAAGLQDDMFDSSEAEIVVTLLEAGCDADAPDAFGVSARTRLQNARENLGGAIAAYEARKAMKMTINGANLSSQPG